MRNAVHFGDNLSVLRHMEDASFDLVYIDPPFNTGKVQRRTELKTVRSDVGDRIGYKGKRYQSIRIGSKEYADIFDDYLSFLEPRIIEVSRVLKQAGSFYLHLDYREVHYARVLCDQIFGRECFLNEIIWAYDYGARQKRKWPTKHDTILVYVKDPEAYFFDTEEVDRIPYMAPGLVGAEKAALGKLPTDTWWHTIVSPTGKEKTGYPTQKPLGILRRVIAASSPKGGRVLDCFAGSGTTGEAAHLLGRSFVLIDDNEEAIRVMKRRLSHCAIDWIGCDIIRPDDRLLAVEQAGAMAEGAQQIQLAYS